MRLLGDIASVFTLIGGLFFTLTYAALVRWWADWIGRAVFMLAACLTLTFALVATSIFFGTVWPHRLALRALIFFGVGVPLYALGIALVNGQVRKYRREREELLR